MKTCKKCNIEKPLNRFANVESKGKIYKESKCKNCRSKERALKRKLNPEKEALRKRKQRLRSKYGISLEDYSNMYNVQKGKCKICNIYHNKLDVDHCHHTSKIRYLLCNRCNTGLGHFKDNPDLLRKAALYLEETHTAKNNQE